MDPDGDPPPEAHTTSEPSASQPSTGRTAPTTGQEGSGPADAPPADLDAEVERLRGEVARLEAEAASVGTTRARVQSIASTTTLVLTILAVLLATITVWISGSVFDTQRFLAIVDPALRSPEVETALGSRLSAESIEALDLENRLETALGDVQSELGDQLAAALDVTPRQRNRLQALPLPQLQQLAAPIASGLEARVETRIEELVASDRFQELLVDTTAAAHTKAVALVRGDQDQLPNVVVADGEVTVDLVPLVASALAELVDEGLELVGIDQVPFVDVGTDPEAGLARLSSALGVDLPPDFGQVPIMSSADLAELQTAARTMDRLVWAIVVVALVLGALTLVLAADRRRALVQLGLGTALAVVVALPVIRAMAGGVSDVAATPQGRDAFAAVAEIAVDSLRATMVVVLVVSLLVALVAHLLGRPPWLASVLASMSGTDRRPVAFVVRHRALLMGVVVALAALAWWLVGLSLWSVVVIPVVAGAALAALQVSGRPVDDADGTSGSDPTSTGPALAEPAPSVGGPAVDEPPRDPTGGG